MPDDRRFRTAADSAYSARLLGSIEITQNLIYLALSSSGLVDARAFLHRAEKELHSIKMDHLGASATHEGTPGAEHAIPASPSAGSDA